MKSASFIWLFESTVRKFLRSNAPVIGLKNTGNLRSCEASTVSEGLTPSRRISSSTASRSASCCSTVRSKPSAAASWAVTDWPPLACSTCRSWRVNSALNMASETRLEPAVTTSVVAWVRNMSFTPQMPNARIRRPISTMAAHDFAKARNAAIMAGEGSWACGAAALAERPV